VLQSFNCLASIRLLAEVTRRGGPPPLFRPVLGLLSSTGVVLIPFPWKPMLGPCLPELDVIDAFWHFGLESLLNACLA